MEKKILVTNIFNHTGYTISELVLSKKSYKHTQRRMHRYTKLL